MKKITLLALLSLFFVSMYAAEPEPKSATEAQSTQQTQVQTKKYGYCQLIGQTTYYFKKIKTKVSFDFGENQSFWSREQWLKNESVRNINFSTMTDAMNHMQDMGWELVQAYAVRVEDDYTYHHWVLRLELE
ncbi:hypothetical protein D0T49_12395 [Paludibacter sp. 221]|uniref:hypothetical protein n=1 Tax=Paludibacter sp. 221 TaxID=2302939 RepID=UPI0013D65EA2|nr:hypothetical protein [Paludibacter sp. 221]NDV47846.1 hypothetical protein [Paludibacter sp. 221]